MARTPVIPVDQITKIRTRTTWARPAFRKQEVNAAGRFLLSAGEKDFDWFVTNINEYDHSLHVINNWRSSHGYPLNTFQMNLRNASKRADPQALIAQRTKRLASITAKLSRFHQMKLTQMQDIGGCRAVVTNVKTVQRLADYYLAESKIKHELATVDDYIAIPQQSGYRGVHLVYRYFSDSAATSIYNGLKIEMQLRSKYQHAWATAVETVGAFVREALKSSAGSDEWLRFFALMGTAIALREGSTPVPGTPHTHEELICELRDLATFLNVDSRLRAYGEALQRIEGTTKDAHYFLLDLDTRANELKITGYRTGQLSIAQEKYLEIERYSKEKPEKDAVLVSVESIGTLPRAYPNYFADTRVFSGPAAEDT